MKYSTRSVSNLEQTVAYGMRIEKTILNAIQNSNAEVKEALAKLHKDLSGAPDRSKTKIITNWHVTNEAGLTQVTDMILEAAAAEKRRSIEEKLLDSLYFPSIKDRRSRIPDAHARTFRWIYDRSPRTTHRWTDFVKWLQDRDRQIGLYWVTGKAGSGKS